MIYFPFVFFFFITGPGVDVANFYRLRLIRFQGQTLRFIALRARSDVRQKGRLPVLSELGRSAHPGRAEAHSRYVDPSHPQFRQRIRELASDGHERLSRGYHHRQGITAIEPLD